MAENAPVISDVGTGPVVETESVDLDAWAREGDAASEQAGSKPRQPDGKFARRSSGDGDIKEVSKVLKNSIDGLSRPPKGMEKASPPPARRAPPPQEDADDETHMVDEEEEAPPPKVTRKVKGVVNGEETEIDLDAEEFQKLNAVQMAKASQKAFREAAEMRKEAQQLRQALEVARENVERDPSMLFKALGLDEAKVVEFAQRKALEKVYETIDPNTGQPYTPEQQRIIQLQRELQARDAAEQDAKAKEEAAQMEKMKDVIRQDVDRKFTTALKETGLPPTPYTMMRLANLMEQMGPDVDPQMVAPMVLEDVVTEIVHTLNTIPVETAVELLGEKFMKELRQYDIAKSRAGRDKFGRTQKIPGNAPNRVPSSKGPITDPTEAQDYLEKWASQK